MTDYKISANLTANVSKFKRAIERAKRSAESLKREVEGNEPELDADISPLKRAVLNAKRLISSIKDEKAEAKIDIDDGALNSRIAFIKAMLRSIPNRIRTRVDVDYDRNIFKMMSNGWKNVQNASERYQNRMDQIANSIRTFGTVIGNQIKGSLIASFSALIPIIATLVPAIMAVGNAIAVVGGGAIGIAGAFSIAGAGAVAFGGMATSAVKMLNNGMLKATKATQNYNSALDEIKSTWQDIVKQNADQLFNSMANGMKIATSALRQLQPFLSSIASSVESASQKMLNWVKTSNIASKAFDMLNTTGVKVFDNMLSGLGKIGAGFTSLLTSFAPLIDWMASGFKKMSAAFLDWATSVETANGIKNFINYTKANLPLIGKIFGNTFMGLFNLFKAFSSNSQTIFESLAQMSERFMQWSETIASSDGFKKFINYVQTNGPVVINLIGSLINLIINLATAMAPLGAAVLGIITGFTDLLAKLTEAHPIIGQILGIIITLGGILMAIIPTIVSVTSFITPLIGALLGLEAQAGFVQVAMAAFTAVIGALSGPVLVVIAVIGALVATFIYLWNTNEGFRAAVIVIWNNIMAVIMSVVNAISSFVMEIWAMLVTWWQQNNQLILQTIQTVWNLIGPIIMGALQVVAGIVKLGWEIVKTVTIVAWELIKGIVKVAITLLGGIIRAVMQIINGDWRGAWETIKQTAITIWNIIKSTAISVWNALKAGIIAILNALKATIVAIWNLIKAVITAIMNAIKSVVTSIWNAIKAVVTSVMNGIKTAITTAWNAIKSAVQNAMNGIRNTVQTGMNNVKSAVTNGVQGAVSAAKSFVGAMVSAGSDLIRGMINGIKNMAGALVNAAKGVVSNAISAAKSLLKINSPSRVFRDIGMYTMMGMTVGIDREGRSTISATAEMARRVTSAFNPQLVTPQFRGIEGALNSAQSQLNTQLQSNVNVDAKPQSIVVKVEGNAEWIRAHVNEQNAIDESLSF